MLKTDYVWVFQRTLAGSFRIESLGPREPSKRSLEIEILRTRSNHMAAGPNCHSHIFYILERIRQLSILWNPSEGPLGAFRLDPGGSRESPLEDPKILSLQHGSDKWLWRGCQPLFGMIPKRLRCKGSIIGSFRAPKIDPDGPIERVQ